MKSKHSGQYDITNGHRDFSRCLNLSVGENTNILSYDDVHHVSEYAIGAMQYAVGSGLIKGKTESTLNPLDNATRAEAAAILERFIKAN